MANHDAKVKLFNMAAEHGDTILVTKSEQRWTGMDYQATCESFNGKMRDEFLNGEIFYSLKEAEFLVEKWRREYNHIRPHSSLGYKPPVPLATLPSYERDEVLRNCIN